MNIFFLSADPTESAISQYDKHVVKMPLESAQMLCTAHRLLDGVEYIDDSSGRKIKRWKLPDDLREDLFYKATHVNHPSNIWARGTIENYLWLYRHFIALCEEYTRRYGKIHKCERDLKEALKYPPNSIKKAGLQPVPQAMPDQYRSDDTVQAYRDYYNAEKITEGTVYTDRQPPSWIRVDSDSMPKTVDEKTGKTKWKFQETQSL